MNVGRTFRKLVKAVAVVAALLPSFTQAFIPLPAINGAVHSRNDAPPVEHVLRTERGHSCPRHNGGWKTPAPVVHAIVDENNKIVNRYAYTSFGVIDWDYSYEGVVNRYTFQGREYDAERGDYSFRNRLYFPEWGLFSGPDMNFAVGPYAEAHGMMSYVFCANDPWTYGDPLGLEPGDWLGEMGPAPMVSGSMDVRFAPPGAWSRQDPYVQRMAAVAEITEQRAHDFLRYTKNSRDFVVKGEYYEGEVNIAGISGAIGMGLLGVDLPADIRDVYHNFTHWQWSWSHAGKTSLNAIGVIPFVGVVKNARHLQFISRADNLEALGHFSEVKRLSVKVSAGVDIIGTSGRTTTVLGKYTTDMKAVIQEVTGGLKRWDNIGEPGGINVLNVPDGVSNRWGADVFWNLFNRPFLDDAIKRGDEIVLATRPSVDVLINSMGQLTGFGREYRYLLDKGFVYDSATSRMIRQ